MKSSGLARLKDSGLINKKKGDFMNNWKLQYKEMENRKKPKKKKKWKWQPAKSRKVKKWASKRR